MARQQAKGACSYCGQLFTKRGMLGHLSKCNRRLAMIEKAEQSAAKSDLLIHLRASDSYSKSYWLDLEVNGSAKLKDLDRYLRKIWLECCGHLSRFTDYPVDWSVELDMRQPICAAFEPGGILTHLYDYGTTSETVLECIGGREGKPTTRNPIALMARNEPLHETCDMCDNPATQICNYCYQCCAETCWFCGAHAAEHQEECEDGWVSSIFNSPRMGLCGYEGPATAPY